VAFSLHREVSARLMGNDWSSVSAGRNGATENDVEETEGRIKGLYTRRHGDADGDEGADDRCCRPMIAGGYVARVNVGG
jgi:hypothetical protein